MTVLTDATAKAELAAMGHDAATTLAHVKQHAAELKIIVTRFLSAPTTGDSETLEALASLNSILAELVG